MKDQIEQRIRELTLERKVLEDTHNFQVQQNQKINQEFQQKVVQNQTRFAQITGAVLELQKLVQQPTKKETHNDNSFSSPNIGHRIADVCLSEQPEGR